MVPEWTKPPVSKSPVVKGTGEPSGGDEITPSKRLAPGANPMLMSPAVTGVVRVTLANVWGPTKDTAKIGGTESVTVRIASLADVAGVAVNVGGKGEGGEGKMFPLSPVATVAAKTKSPPGGPAVTPVDDAKIGMEYRLNAVPSPTKLISKLIVLPGVYVVGRLEI